MVGTHRLLREAGRAAHPCAGAHNKQVQEVGAQKISTEMFMTNNIDREEISFIVDNFVGMLTNVPCN